jgi:hypothetical protein
MTVMFGSCAIMRGVMCNGVDQLLLGPVQGHTIEGGHTPRLLAV